MRRPAALLAAGLILSGCGTSQYEHQGTVERGASGVGGYVHNGAEQIRLGNYDRAIELLTIAINHEPTRDDAYYHRGIAHHLKGDIDLALEDLGDAVRVNLHNSRAWFKRGWIQQNNRARFQDALKDYTRAVEEDPAYADAYYFRGLTYQAIRVFHRAADDMAKALAVCPLGWDFKAEAELKLAICRKQSTTEGSDRDPLPTNPR